MRGQRVSSPSLETALFGRDVGEVLFRECELLRLGNVEPESLYIEAVNSEGHAVRIALPASFGTVSPSQFVQKLCTLFNPLHTRYQWKVHAINRLPVGVKQEGLEWTDPVTGEVLGWFFGQVPAVAKCDKQSILGEALRVTLSIDAKWNAPLISRSKDQINSIILNGPGNFSAKCTISQYTSEGIQLEFCEMETENREIELKVSIGEINMTMSDFLELRAGSSIEISLPQEFPATIAFGDLPVAEAVGTVIEGQLQIIIQELHGEKS